MRLADPMWLLLLFSLPWIWRRGLGALGTDLKGLGLAENLRANARPRRNPLIFKILATISLLGFTLGFARLEGPAEVHWVEGRGLDLLIAVDVSRSMDAQDLSPNRLSAARRTVERMARRLEGDRFALMTFAGTSHLLCPFTRDGEMFSRYLGDVRTGSLPVGGTNLASVFDASLRAFEEGGEGDRVLVVLTDGEEHESDEAQLKPMVEALRDAGVRSFFVTVGSELGEPVPDGEGGYLRDKAGRPVVSRAQGLLLAQLAEIAEGQHLAIRPGRDAATQLERALVELERGAHQPIRSEARPRWFLFCLLLGLIFGALFWRWPRVLVLLVLPMLTGFAGPEHEDPDAAAGVQALEAGNAEEALAAFDAAESRGQDPRLDYNRGLALLRLGRHEEAARALGRATARLEGDELVRALTARGEAFAKAGDKERALHQLRQALIRQPGHQPATRWLRHLLAPVPKPPDQDSNEQGEGDDEGDQDKEDGEEKSDNKNPDDDGQRDENEEGKDDESEAPQSPDGDQEQDGGPEAEPPPDEPTGPDAGPGPMEPNPAQDAAEPQGDAGPRSPSQGLLDSYRARQQLLPLETWQPPQSSRPVEKEW